MRKRSRLVIRFNKKLVRNVIPFFVVFLIAFCALWIPSIVKISSEKSMDRLELISDDYDSMISGFQQKIYTFTHGNDLLSKILPEYEAGGSKEAEAQIALLAQNMKASDNNVLNFCFVDSEGNLVSNFNYTQVDRRTILDNLPSYRELRGGKVTSLLSPLMDGMFIDSENVDHPFFVYAQRVRLRDKYYIISIFYDATYFLRKQNKQLNGAMDGYTVLDRNGNEIVSVGTNSSNNSGVSPENERTTGTEYRIDGTLNYLYSSTSNLRFMSFTSSYTLLAEVIPTLILAIGILMVMTILYTVMISKAGTVFFKPLLQLSHEMRNYEPGKKIDLDISEDDEIGDLCKDYKRMADKVDQQFIEISEKERSNAVTQYRLLATQIDPHFFYNTMSMINALAFNGDSNGVIEVNTALIRLLRERLNTKATIMDSVAKEIETLDEYLKIMAYRYGDSVSVTVDCDPEIREIKIPKNLLQPVIENSFLHGLTNEEGVCEGNIGILIYEMDKRVVIEISDDGKGMTQDIVEKLNAGEDPENGKGRVHIGFDNIRQRLNYIYCGDFELTVHSVQERGTTVTIVLPMESKNEES